MLHPRGKDKVVAVLESYCDESGIHEGAPVCVVAGWIATARNWQLFEDRWLRASGGVDFHGKEFFVRDPSGERVGPYKGWSDDKAQTYLRGLVHAITTSDIKPVGSVINVAAFKSFSLDDRKWLTGASWSPKRQKWLTSGAPTRPYYLGFVECLEGSALSVKKPGWTVNFCFDQQHELAPWALLFFQNAKKGDSPQAKRLGDAIFKSKAGVGALQAADMLAHSFYRTATSGINRDLQIVTDALDPVVAGRIVRNNKEDMERRIRDRQRYIRKVSA